MKESIQAKLEDLWEDPLTYYGTSLIVGGTLTFLLFFFFGPLWLVKLSFFAGITLAIARFIAGLGLPLIWATGCVYILKLAPKFKGTFLFSGTKKEVKRIILFLNIGAILILIMMVVWQLTSLLSLRRYLPLVGGIREGGGMHVTAFLPMGGILYFMLGTYILPTWKKAPEIKEERGILDKIKDKFGTLKRKVKKGYWKYLQRDFLKYHLEEYVLFRSRFDERREKIAWMMILPIALGLLALPIISLPAIFIWIKLVVPEKPKRIDSKLEKMLLIAFLATSAVYLSLTLSPSYQEILGFPELVRKALWTIPYIGGAVGAFYLFSQSTMSEKLPF